MRNIIFWIKSEQMQFLDKWNVTQGKLYPLFIILNCHTISLFFNCLINYMLLLLQLMDWEKLWHAISIMPSRGLAVNRLSAGRTLCDKSSLCCGKVSRHVLSVVKAEKVEMMTPTMAVFSSTPSACGVTESVWTTLRHGDWSSQMEFSYFMRNCTITLRY